MSVAVAMLGARMHYAVPRILHRAGLLAQLFTDFQPNRGLARLLGLLPAAWSPTPLRRALGRVAAGIPPGRVTAFNGFGFRYSRAVARARTEEERLGVFLRGGRMFCERVLRHGLGAARGLFVYNSVGLELLEAARQRGVSTFLEQTIAPMAYAVPLLAQEHLRFPDWEDAPSDGGAVREYAEREIAEWKLAGCTLCGSEFVRQAVIACGGPSERCVVIPYGVDNSFEVPERRPHGGPLRVLTVGSVGLRKGSPYVAAVARSLGGRAVFRLVGTLPASASARAELAGTVEVTGPVARSAIRHHYAWADVFFLPSICEGSATAVYEALTAALPVICTPNTGSVVRDGIDGFIVPIRAVEAMAERIERLAADEGLRRFQSANARQRAAECSLETYGTCLLRQFGATIPFHAYLDG